MILTDQLRDENEKIKMALRVLESISKRMDSPVQVDPEDLGEVVELTGVLVQRLHMKKEEALLVSTMEESPVNEHGSLAQLLSEHSEIRKSFQEMKESVNRYRAGEWAARSAVSEAMRLYLEQLGGHLETAERDLYGRSEILLPRRKLDKLIQKFDRLDKSETDRDLQMRRLLKLAQTYLE
jgi:hemerythrin-like domain-containing protein